MTNRASIHEVPQAQALMGDLAFEERSELHAYAAGAAADELVVNWLDWIHDDPKEATGKALAKDVDAVIALLTGWRDKLAKGEIKIPAPETGPYPSERIQ